MQASRADTDRSRPGRQQAAQAQSDRCRAKCGRRAAPIHSRVEPGASSPLAVPNWRPALDAITTGLLITLCVFAGGVAGLNLHRVVPRSHLAKETLDTIRLGTAMLSVLASLVLGLLIATVKTSYDSTNAAVRQYATDLLVLDETLHDYGNEALPARRLLRDYTTRLLDDVWTRRGVPALVEHANAARMMEQARDAIRALNPANNDQRWLADQALQISTTVLRQRWLLIEQSGRSVHPAVIVILVLWIIAIFASFGLAAPRNATVYAAFFICSLAIGSAIFLILQLDTPFEGLMRISDQPVRIAVAHMLLPGQ